MSTSTNTQHMRSILEKIPLKTLRSQSTFGFSASLVCILQLKFIRLQYLFTTINTLLNCFLLAVGNFKGQRAKLYELNTTRTEIGGTTMATDQEAADEAESHYNEVMMGWFHFAQTEDGSIPATYYSREEDGEIVNTKKAIVSAFQANFLGTKVKEEADLQSMHKAIYRYV